MEDSKIWWYLILGAIYLISKFLKKKKPIKQPQQGSEKQEVFQQEEENEQPQNTPSSIEEILKELSQQSSRQEEVIPDPGPTKLDPIPERVPEPLQTYSREARPFPSQSHNVEAVGADEEVDIVPHKQLQRDKPVYERSGNFAIVEYTNELSDDIHSIFQDSDGARKAFIYGEVFNRKY